MSQFVPIVCAAVLFAGAATLWPGRVLAQGDLITEEYFVPSGDPGIEIYVRNKRLRDQTVFPAERIVLFVHGATYPAETSFDLPLEGWSWMDYIASRGYDVYLMDVRGYGRSTRPPEMSGPPEAYPPVAGTDVAVRDFGTVVDHILARRGVDRINLMGWSWGTVTSGAYAARHADKVARLILFAPLWLRDTPSPIDASGELGAYRTVTREAALARWLSGVPESGRETLLPAHWFDAWWEANMAADPVGARQSPPVVRAPNGVLLDSRRYWAADTRYYDPAGIRAPVLLVHGDWDADTPAYMSQALFARLTGAPVRRYVVIGEGTHTVLLEKNRMQLFREVQLFLDEALDGE